MITRPDTNFSSENENTNLPYPTHYFCEHIDYKECAQAEKGKAVYFGSRQALGEFYNDIDSRGQQSSYFGRVLYPERKDRTEATWSYEKNMAFWAAIIDNNRPLVLLTDIRRYPKASGSLIGTVHEILWLVDNGYTLTFNKSNPTQTAFVPPTHSSKEKTLYDYTYSDPVILRNRFLEIKNAYLQRNEQENGQKLAKISPKTTLSTTRKPLPSKRLPKARQESEQKTRLTSAAEAGTAITTTTQAATTTQATTPPLILKINVRSLIEKGFWSPKPDNEKTEKSSIKSKKRQNDERESDTRLKRSKK